MQMFEDAITRWKHSRTCKGSRKVTDDKDLNGQVIQLYVKADKVSYQENNIPGQGIVKYKPHIKKKSAELKCLICQNRFLSLDDIREHVKYPCRRAYYKSEESLEDEEVAGLDDIKDPTLIKIRRAEFAPSKETEVSASGSGLSVLAEASKHIESLIPGNNSLNSLIERQLKGPNLYTAEATNNTGVNTQLPTKKTKPKSADPLLIVFQHEDGSLLPVDQLDPDIVASTVTETAESLPVGQVIQVQLGTDTIQNYVKTSRGDVVAVHAVKTEAEIQKTPSSFTTAKEVKEASVNTPHQVDSLERSTPPPLQYAPTNVPSTSFGVAQTQTVPTVPSVPSLFRPSLQDLLQRPSDTIEAVPLHNPVSGVANLESGYIVQTSLPVVEVKQKLVLEETVEEQGFLLPTEEQVYI